MGRYEVLRHIPVGDDNFAPGDIIDSTDYEDRDWSMMARVGDVKPIAEVVGEEHRDENGDTAELAELRKLFNAAFAKQGEEVEQLKSDVAERDGTIVELREKLAALPTLGDPADDDASAGSPLPASSQEPNTSGASGEGAVATPAFTVKDKGRGWFAIVIDGQEVTKSLRADDVELFPAMTPDEQAAFVEANKPSD